MADTFELEICTPDRLLVREQVTDVQIPAANGYLGLLPGHAALLSQLGTGEMSYTSAGRVRHLVIHGGFLEVLGGNTRVLTDAAEMADEIDEKRARESLQRASERLAKPIEGMDVARALNAMRRAEARLKAAARSK
jgi:F-type H+-transporting ATPase subunit epsilon